jgi:hypothetical protein
MSGPARFNDLADLAEGLMEVAEAGLRAAASLRRKKPDRRPKRFVTLRPGPDTPVWNQLVRSAAPFFRRRGDKVKLARLLGISRQRLHQLLVARTACADAERTLLLLAWINARRAGRDWS